MIRILVVEDSPTQAEALKAHLEAADYGVTVATRGDEALELLENDGFDLVLSDIVMPGPVDGYELCRQIKIEGRARMPVFLLTSLSDPMDIIRGLQCGADNFLTKPYDPEELIERIELLLRTRRIRSKGRLKTGVRVYFMGQEHVITSEREQILDLLMTTFERAVTQNDELRRREEQLTAARNELARYARSLEARLERIVSSVPDVILSASPNLEEVHYVSPAAHSVFGCPPDEFSFEYWRERLADDDHDRVLEALRVAAEERRPQRMEYRFRRNGTGLSWISQTIIPVEEADRVSRIDAIARDVTDRRRTENRLRRIAESGMIGVIQWDRDGHIIEANDEFLRILGYDRADVEAGLKWTELTPPEWEEADERALEQIAATGYHSPFEKEFFRKDGSRAHVLVSGAAFEDRPEEGVALVLDRTERKEALDRLQESEARVRLLLDSTAEGIYGLDPDGHCTFCNPAAAEMLGYDDPDELLDRTMHPLIHHSHEDGSDYDVEECPIYRAFLEGAGVHVTDEALWRTDGTSFPAEYWSYPIKEDGEVVGAVVTFLDITERKDLEEQAVQSQKLEAVGQLAGGIAHDFNNLLTVTIGEAELALMDEGVDPAVRDSLSEIQDAGERARLLTRQLLTFSRRDVVAPTMVNWNDVASGMETMLRRLIGEHIHTEFRLDPDVDAVEADRGQLEQVLMNLAINARDAMSEGGDLIIETANAELSEEYADRYLDVDPGEYAVLVVSDTGEGMGPETQKHLFEPFFTTKEKDKGTGLGLATSYGIVQRWGGHIGVYSEPGVGTTMKVYLPRVAGEREWKSDEREAADLSGTETILLVEDDERVLNTTARMLRACGYTVLEAGDEATALELTESHEGPINLLLTDVVLPDSGGRELADKIQSVRPGTPVLYLSGYTDDVILKRAILEPGVDLVQKPFTSERLARKVREVLDADS